MRGSLRVFDRLLFAPNGARRLPTVTGLDRALGALPPGGLWRYCETRPTGPLYLLPTREFVRALAEACRKLGRRVLEVGAGDGFLARALTTAAPDLEVRATDSGGWSKSSARMTPAEQRQWRRVPLAGIPLGQNVERLDALDAVRRYRPDVVVCSWLPPGPLLSQVIRSPCRCVIDIGAGRGVTAQGAWDWRFAHDFLEPLEQLARCRLDERPAKTLHSRVTLYFGRLHPEFGEERPRRGDWLYQFKPVSAPAPPRRRVNRPGAAR
jgi:hypothetical protein